MPPEPKSIEQRFFLCTGQCVKYADLHKYSESHIVGHLCYVTDEGRQVTALARWVVSVTCSVVPPLKPEIDCFILGDVRRLKCCFPGCQNKQRWEIGKAGFLALMKRYGKSTMEEALA